MTPPITMANTMVWSVLVDCTVSINDETISDSALRRVGARITEPNMMPDKTYALKSLRLWQATVEIKE
ncbi:hypothetical protein [Vibrio caribbeanicus]|uniref:hypothetical protein n=1 Tax=Vibrio caribbeanicus TaxID=701175 RepID=UPI0022848464|nr:hypothetical protein [Vibrio caribbeanicus]MCY9845525.1 hypothetical protein [Vibrio caribbeanicus]